MATIQDHKAFAEIIFGKEKADIMFGNLEEKENNKTVFETSTGKTVKLIWHDRDNHYTKEVTGIIENLTGSKIYLNVNNCLEIYKLSDIDMMYQVVKRRG